MPYSDLQGLTVEVRDGIAHITMRFQGEGEVTRRFQHRELTQIWRRLDADPDVRVALITGGGEEFYLSGRPPGGIPSVPGVDPGWHFALHMESEVAELVRELTRFGKPLIAAVNGPAAGAGLSVVMLADIAVVDEDTWLFDPHIMLGMAAGDGAGGIWPLYTGIAKAKLYLLTSDALSGREAERLGFVGRAVPAAEVQTIAADYASRLAAGPPTALRFTKRAINQWLRLADLVSQDYAATLEGLAIFSGERASNPHTPWPPRIVP